MRALKSQESLDHNLNLVKDLIEKQKIVKNLAHLQNSDNVDLVDSLVHKQHLAALERKLKKIHTADIAYILEALPIRNRILLWDIVKFDRGAELLLELSDVVRATLIEHSSEDELIKILAKLDGEDLAYIADDIPSEVLAYCQSLLTPADKSWLHSSYEYTEDEIGHWMSNEYIAMYSDQKLLDIANRIRGLKEIPIHNDKIFITDRRGELKGSIKIQDILLHETKTRVEEIMQTNLVRFDASDDAGEVAKAFERYDLVSAPVVNSRGKLIGRLTVDAIIDIIREESNEEVLSMAGLQKAEDLFSPIIVSAKNRGLWLVINLISAFIASRVIGLFEGIMIEFIALAVLMPIVASVGGNTGNQTTALVIRGLAQGQVSSHNLIHLIKKELGIGILNGTVLGVLVGLFAQIFYSDIHLSLVIGFAMLTTLIFASLMGLAVPILLDKLGKDPALGSSVIQTATTDSVGFLIFLGMASIFLF